FLSVDTISIGFIRIRHRAPKIAPQAKNFYKNWKLICASMSIPTRSIAPAKFHRKISRDWRKSVRLESRCPRNMAASVYRNPIMGGRQCCLEVGTETLPRLFPRINRSEWPSRCYYLGQKSRSKNIFHAWPGERSQHSR